MEGSLPSLRTSSDEMIMGWMLLPMEFQAASALAPVRTRQMDGGSVSQKVPFVVRESLGMLKRSSTGAVE